MPARTRQVCWKGTSSSWHISNWSVFWRRPRDTYEVLVERLSCWRGRACTDPEQLPTAHLVPVRRRNGLVAGLGELQAAREAVAVDVPVELLQYVDGGGNPDAFTADVFRRANRGNQLAKGRVQALAGFRCAAAPWL